MTNPQSNSPTQDHRLNADGMLCAIKERRTVREFDQQKEVSDSDILTILDAGHWAPSSKNQRPWHFVVIKDTQLIERIMTAKTPQRPEGESLLKFEDMDADKAIPKVMIVVFFEKKKSIMVDPRSFGDVDKSYFSNLGGFAFGDLLSIGCAVQNMSLAAHSLGLGSCITGDLLEYGINPQIYGWLGMDKEEYRLMCGLRIGHVHPAARKNMPFRSPLQEHVRWK